MVATNNLSEILSTKTDSNIVSKIKKTLQFIDLQGFNSTLVIPLGFEPRSNISV